MKKFGINVKDEKLRVRTNKEKLLAGIPMAIVGTTMVYYGLTYIQTNREIFENRPTGSVVVAVLDIFPPLFWAGILLIVGIIETARLIILIIREKNEDKVQ